MQRTKHAQGVSSKPPLRKQQSPAPVRYLSPPTHIPFPNSIPPPSQRGDEEGGWTHQAHTRHYEQSPLRKQQLPAPVRCLPPPTHIPPPQSHLSPLPGGRRRGGCGAPSTHKALRADDPCANSNRQRQPVASHPPRTSPSPMSSLPPPKGETKKEVGRTKHPQGVTSKRLLRKQQSPAPARCLSPPTYIPPPQSHLSPLPGGRRRGGCGAPSTHKALRANRLCANSNRQRQPVASHPPRTSLLPNLISPPFQGGD